MDQENNNVETVLSMFSMLDFSKPEVPREKTIDEILEEFPVLNYDYGSASYCAKKFPMLPAEIYIILKEELKKNSKPCI